MATQKLLPIFSSLSILLLLYCFETTVAAPNCPASSCGIITNISYPFRLKTDPKHCGIAPRFELVCENDVATLSLEFQKYYVKEINYHNSTIWLVDASIDNDTCSFTKTSSSSFDELTYPYFFFPYYFDCPVDAISEAMCRPRRINLMSCPYPLKNSSLFTKNVTTYCASSYSNSSHPKPKYTYIKFDRMSASDVPERCGVDGEGWTSWNFKNENNASLLEIHHSLLYGFEARFCTVCKISSPLRVRRVLDGCVYFITRWHFPVLFVIVGVICAGVLPPVMTITIGFFTVPLLFFLNIYSTNFSAESGRFYIQKPTAGIFNDLVKCVTIVLGPKLVISPIAFWFLIYKFRRRHLSVYNIIESFLQNDSKLSPIRYSYSDIKKMTRGFKDKLGEGGYGFVYKGKIRSGQDVAVKLLRESRANGHGQDFINEISTIGRIHHVNVIKLVGYCAKGSKRALVFDFMPNGSLEKYLFNREGMNSLNLDMKFKIAVGVARGIDYLHRGCDVQILHFDIKPHNVLLDDKFIPKISDFGLAKLFSTDKNAVTMTAARGTIGYVAPELINRSIGVVSYKADVYSFGMLLVEMVSLNKDLAGNEDDSNLYFPYWIYDCFNQGRDIGIESDDSDKDDSARRLVRKMTVVALWCIQMYPNDRPSMNKVLEMLEGNFEQLRIPDYPSQSTQTEEIVGQSGSIYSTDSVALLNCDGISSNIDISIQD